MVVAVVVLQLGFVARGYWSDHKEFAFQMFPESSTWRADVVRVTADGRRVPIERPWSGYRWDELVPNVGLRYPAVRHHADAGLDNQLAFLESALDWVAGNTPRDRETRYLEASGDLLAQRRPAPGRGPPEPCPRGRVSAAVARARASPRSTTCSAARSACGRSRCCGCWSARSCSCTCGRSSPTAWTGGPTGTPSTSPTPPGIRSCPSAVYVGLLWLAAVAAVAMSLGLLTRLATATTFAIVAYNLFLSTTHFHNNRAYLVIVLGLLAVAPCGRELSLDAWLRRRRGRRRSTSRRRPGRCGCSGSSAPRSTGRPA